MSMKKSLSVLFSFLMVSIFFLVGLQPAKASTETSTEISTTAACKSPGLTYHSKNSATKEVTFKATGTPNNMVSINIYKYLAGTLVTGGYAYLNSSGEAYISFTVANGSYEASLTQESPCSGSVGPLFFTMN